MIVIGHEPTYTGGQGFFPPTRLPFPPSFEGSIMSRTMIDSVRSLAPRSFLAVLPVAGLLLGQPATGGETNRVDRPDYQQAAQFSSEYLRQFMYDTAVLPRWIG